MAPKVKADISLLFHPKKNKKNTPVSSPRPPPPTAPNGSRPSSPVKAKPSPKPSPPKPNTDDDEADLQLPDGPYQEFRIMSSALNGWKYDVMKFDSRKSVDILRWQQPIKLNRKDLRREDPEMSGVGQAVRPMVGLDGQPVIGPDGKMVMVDNEGRPVTENGASGSGAGKGKGPANGKKKFQKKTRQVFIVPDEIRNLRKEERYPWVVEDGSGQEVWTAQLDDLGKAETHAFLMPAANDVFKFVPSHRYYKFQKKLKHDMPTDTTSVESAYQKSLKRDPSTWLHQRNGKGPSAATAAMFKAEAEGQTLAGGNNSLVHQTQQSLGPGGRRLKAVDSGADDLFGEDDDEDSGAAKRRAKEFGGEGDMDEMVYEEDFADDEEKMDVEETNDQETKELEERLKKEYKNANKTREGYIDESDEEEEKPGMSKQAKRMQKMLRNREGNDVYDSEDEEDNPYASSQEEEEEEEEVATQTGPAVQSQSQSKSEPPTPSPSQTSNTNPASEPTKATPQANGTGPTSGSRATSPVPGLGGHSVVAKRATSPKAPKPKPNPANTGRSGSPLASRANSPVAPVAASGTIGATSPPTPGSRAGSPTAVNGVQNGQTQNKKRKAEDAGSPPPNSPTNNVPKAKKRKAHPTSSAVVAVPTGPLEDRLLIEWLKNTPTANASTRECIQYFTPYLTDEEKKAQFTGLVKEIAQLKNGVLVLRPAYRDSPVATPTASG
ncbi:transcription initiation factor [Lentinula guzmanii]|uniref:Transcription initiation factor n=1 Tax=Lentinula guzmanii TaxID=2804957 RepID=A0AA38N3S1_9AGAR|nr:transcription initiation factor [Lentinula guzmanii]